MNDDLIPGAIIERLSRVRVLEARLVERLEDLQAPGPSDREAAEALGGMPRLAAHHLHDIEELADRRGAELDDVEPTVGPRESERALSSLLEDVATAAASAVVAYGALYASARLLYEIEVCDLADAHAADWARELGALYNLLAPAVHGELLQGGLTCRCICPACGIGACGCTRNSIDTIRGHWGQPGLEPSEGLELRLPPRPGSQLAEAGLERGDRIIEVDGELVHTNSEIQRALRRHPIGETMTMQVVRAGEPQEIRVARVSDVPS